MPHPDWNQRFETGNKLIDTQHEQMFTSLSALSQAIHEKKGHDQIQVTLIQLKDYIENHFITEEKFMEDINYPQIEKHKKIHQEYREKTQKIIEDYHSGKKQMAIYLVKFISDWIQNHILEEDIRYIQWLKINKPD